jgi:hypothetical protein
MLRCHGIRTLGYTTPALDTGWEKRRACQTIKIDNYIYVDWVLADTIQEIAVSPYADENYENSVRDAIKAEDPKLADRVVLSALNERRYAPNF